MKKEDMKKLSKDIEETKEMFEDKKQQVEVLSNSVTALATLLGVSPKIRTEITSPSAGFAGITSISGNHHCENEIEKRKTKIKYGFLIFIILSFFCRY